MHTLHSLVFITHLTFPPFLQFYLYIFMFVGASVIETLKLNQQKINVFPNIIIIVKLRDQWERTAARLFQ